MFKFLSRITLVLTLLTPTLSVAEEVFRIEVSKSYDGYSNNDLRRRVWELERAVSQLQQRVFSLEVRKPEAPAPVEKPWTCRIQSFGKTFKVTAPTRGAALGDVLEKCSQGSSAMHCPESDVKCDN